MEAKHTSIIDDLIGTPNPVVKTIIRKQEVKQEYLTAREQRRKDKEEHRNKKKGM